MCVCVYVLLALLRARVTGVRAYSLDATRRARARARPLSLLPEVLRSHLLLFLLLPLDSWSVRFIASVKVKSRARRVSSVYTLRRCSASTLSFVSVAVYSSRLANDFSTSVYSCAQAPTGNVNSLARGQVAFAIIIGTLVS